MISNEVSRQWRRTRLLFVLSVLLVAPLPLVAQSGSTDEDVAASDEANQAKQVVVAKHETKGFDHTLQALKEKPIVLEINDAPMSDLIEYFSKARHLQFKFESDDIKKRRVSIHVSPEEEPALTLRDALLSIFEHFNCEMSILPNGDILVRPASTDGKRGNREKT